MKFKVKTGAEFELELTEKEFVKIVKRYFYAASTFLLIFLYAEISTGDLSNFVDTLTKKIKFSEVSKKEVLHEHYSKKTD